MFRYPAKLETVILLAKVIKIVPLNIYYGDSNKANYARTGSTLAVRVWSYDGL